MSNAQDPWGVLGLGAGASDEAIRAAYLSKLKEHPPDRSGAEFERLRDAYEVLRDPRRRAALILSGGELDLSFTAWFDRAASLRRHVGPDAWRRAVRGR
ncbi:MAG: DnaJ domain-containing protein [Myxococcales bacterium]|nr:DnaJ domain-containing protein [Myxococcales bacterium]